MGTEGFGAGPRRAIANNGLVVGQLALSFVLLVGAVALLARWLPAGRAAATDPTIALRAD